MAGFLALAAASVALLAAMFVPLERVWQARRQPILRAHLALDLTFLAGQYLLWNVLTLLLLREVHGAVREVVPWRAADAWPAGLQVAAAVVLGDLAMYGFHVACHRVPLLWRFHAVHHSTTELDWVAAYREHPFDGLFTQLAMNLPAIALGVSFELLGPLIVFRGLWAIAVHSNTRLPLGPLRWLIGAPELHRYHHLSTGSAAEVKNFANLAPYLDWLFGTHHAPSTEDYPLGVEGLAPRVGNSGLRYLGLLWSPFVRKPAETGGWPAPSG